MSEKSVPAVFERVLPLLTAAPEKPEFRDGYLDLLGDRPEQSPGFVQSLWESGPGSALYDNIQALIRLALPMWYRLPGRDEASTGTRVLDIGCGPGNVTARLGRDAGPDGLAVGLDISRPMLARAARTETSANVGFIRADAHDLPFPDGTFNLVSSLAALQLIPEPPKVLTEMVRVLAPGGRLAVMVPTPRGGLLHQVTKLTGDRTGLVFFEPTEIAEQLHALGLETVHTHRTGPVLWITARRPA